MRALHIGLRGFLLLFMLSLGLRPVAAEPPFKIEDPPATVLRGVPFVISVKNMSPAPLEVRWGTLLARSEGETGGVLSIAPGATSRLEVRAEGAPPWSVQFQTEGSEAVEVSGKSLPGWVSLLPPLIAIGLALITKQVLVALLAGIFCGAFLLQGHLFPAFATTLDTFLVNSITDKDHAFILLFTMALGGMVSLISASGGMQGMVDKMSRWARTPASAQLVAWLMGIAIFFDDYANTLLVGQTMKPVTDRQKISREKLAYLVDSTAAPIASIALISTWIGYEMSLIGDGFKSVGLQRNVYTVFLQSIAHRYYAIYALVFVLAVALLHRDFGPMLKAEREAARREIPLGAEPSEGGAEEPATWGRSVWDAVLPVAVVLFGTIAGLVYTGLADLGSMPQTGDWVRDVGTLFSAGNSFKALLWSAAGGGIVAALVAKLRYRVTVEQITEVYLSGVTHMMSACVVLILAWAIGDVCKFLFTGPYLVEMCQGLLSPRFLPTVTFLLSSAVAFATGTSWGTMAIVMPLAIRLAYELPGGGLGAEAADIIMISTIAGVLAGSTFGDHCSPISDTTIMSSMASGCDHIEHVRTQIPYAVISALLAVFFGTLPAAFGVNAAVLNVLGIAACFAVVRLVGKPVIEDVPV